MISGAARGTFSDLLAEWTAALGGRLVRYESFDHEPVRAANRQVFGLDQLPAHDFAKAKYIMSFGADFLESWGSPIENQRGFARAHGFAEGDVAKFVYAAPRMDLTGLNADEWLPIKPGSEAALALAMANVLIGARGDDRVGLASALASFTPAMAAQETGFPRRDDRADRAGVRRGAAEPGGGRRGGVAARGVHRGLRRGQPAQLRRGQHRRDGAVRRRPPTADGYAALARLAQAMDAGEIAVALVHDANPAYTLPKSSGFADRFAKVGFKVSTSLYLDETAALCDLLLPQHHALERWDDARPRAGVYGLMQPVMEPVFNTLPAGRHPAAGEPQGGRRAGALHRADLGGAPQDPLAGAGRRAGRGGRSGFWHSAVQRGGVYRDPPAPPEVSLALDGHGCRTPSPPSRATATSRSSPTRTRCCTTAAAPTSRGCWRTPTPSPRSPGTRGSR